MTDKYLYGVRARANAGFGLWQLGFGSKAPPNSESHAAARAAMMNFKSDGGRILGVTPTVLVAPPHLESAGAVSAEHRNAGRRRLQSAEGHRRTDRLALSGGLIMELISSCCAEAELPGPSATGQWVHLLLAGSSGSRRAPMASGAWYIARTSP